MKIAVLSDIHDNLVNLEKALSWCQKNDIDSLLCCGDLTNDETITYLADNFDKPIHVVRGNADSFDEDKLSAYGHLVYYGEYGRILFGKTAIGACHEPVKLERVLKLGKCDAVFYGHTHKPWEEEKLKTRFVNPGTLAGMFQMPTFAVYDTESGELVLQIVDRI